MTHSSRSRAIVREPIRKGRVAFAIVLVVVLGAGWYRQHLHKHPNGVDLVDESRRRAIEPAELAARLRHGTPAPVRLTTTPSSSDSSAVSGGDLLFALRTAIPQMKECLGQLHEQAPNANGEALVRMSVEDLEGVGRATDVAVLPKTGNAGDDEVARFVEVCLKHALSDAAFQPPTSGVVVFSYPLVVRPYSDQVVGLEAPAAAGTVPGTSTPIAIEHVDAGSISGRQP
jgi:hypothetical protein